MHSVRLLKGVDEKGRGGAWWVGGGEVVWVGGGGWGVCGGGWVGGTGLTRGTYSGSESSVSETAGTALRGGNRAGLTAARPLWITSITYLGNPTTPGVRHTLVAGPRRLPPIHANPPHDTPPNDSITRYVHHQGGQIWLPSYDAVKKH